MISLNPIVVAQTAGLITDASKIAESSNPVNIAITIVPTFIDVCAPPQVKYPARCVGIAITFGVALTSPNPFSKVAFLASLRSVLHPYQLISLISFFCYQN